MRVISIVDDDESLRRSVRNLLTSVGFHVETFASAEDFLQSAHREDTGCLVLDLLAHLVATDSRIPAVVLTALSDDEARRRTLRAGAVAFLGKPFHGDALLGAVRSALAEDKR